MIQRIARIGRSRIALTTAAGMMLAAGGMAALPAAPASASTTVVAVFSSAPEYVTPLCSEQGTYSYGGYAAEVYNPCGTRVWVHYYSGSAIESYCVNPGGGLAYDLPITWAGGDTSDLEITGNTSQCDSGTFWGINWFANGFLVSTNTNACEPNNTFTHPGNVYVGWISDGGCDFRIWLHNDNTGASYCMNAAGDSPMWHTAVYLEAQETDNQAPCDAGGPPYPY
jgi:hypothetical protein